MRLKPLMKGRFAATLLVALLVTGCGTNVTRTPPVATGSPATPESTVTSVDGPAYVTVT